MCVEHRLILQPVVLEEEVPAALVKRRPVPRIVPQRRQPAADRLARRDAGEVGGREPVLRLDPVPGLGRVYVLEPAIGVGHFDAVVVIHVVALAGRRIRQCLSACRRHGDAAQQTGQEQAGHG